MVAATIRPVFAQPDAPSAREQWRRVADGFRPRSARLADLLEEAEADVLAYLAFPAEHWRQSWSNTPLERPESPGDTAHACGGPLPHRRRRGAAGGRRAGRAA